MIALAKEFRTERVLLRPFRLSDAEDVFAYASDPAWGEFLPAPYPYQRKDADEFVARQLVIDWSIQAHFAVVFDGHVVGGTGFHFMPAGWANFGYSLIPSLWGKGLVVEAAHPLLTAAFEQVGVGRIEISAIAENHRSRRVAEKLGFTYEGTLRQRELQRGQRRDMVFYGLLPQEWKG